jgi:hypothetical protein
LVEEASLYAPGCDTQRKGGLGCREGNGLRVVGPPWPHGCPVTCGSAAADPPLEMPERTAGCGGCKPSSQDRFFLAVGSGSRYRATRRCGPKGSKRAVLPMCEAPYRATWFGAGAETDTWRRGGLPGNRDPKPETCLRGNKSLGPDPQAPATYRATRSKGRDVKGRGRLQGNEVESCTCPGLQGRTSLQGNKVRGPNFEDPCYLQGNHAPGTQGCLPTGQPNPSSESPLLSTVHLGCLIR